MAALARRHAGRYRAGPCGARQRVVELAEIFARHQHQVSVTDAVHAVVRAPVEVELARVATAVVREKLEPDG